MTDACTRGSASQPTDSKDSELAVLRLACLIGLELPDVCMPGVVASVDALEEHLQVLRASNEKPVG